MSRAIIPLNLGWRYQPNFVEEYIQKNFSDSSFEEVHLPHANKEVPYNYFNEKMYQFVSCYRKHFKLDTNTIGKRIFIDFEGVMTYARVFLNGQPVGEHLGGYTPFSIDVTDYVTLTEENVLVVIVDSTERKDCPPFGNVIDYLTYGGIYREVSLRICDPMHIDKVFVKTEKVLEDEKELTATVFVRNHRDYKGNVGLKVLLKDSTGAVIAKKYEEYTIDSNESPLNLTLTEIKNVALWDVEAPTLYQVTAELYMGEQCLDTYPVNVGFRTAVFSEDGFYLNGRLLKLRGLNRHQAFPYVGYAMPKRAQAKDADILKYDLSLNIVRTSHYPQSVHFLNRCDEVGLLVLEEIPGWQYIGDENWKKIACANVREMIVRDYNHPSIVLWGVRINESPDDHDFYVKTNQIARELDDTRQIGGIRCIGHSELLEDVYTMNDFNLGSGDSRVLRPQQEITGLTYPVPYLVTEYNGHMYPTKRFDQEQRLNEHALRHIAVQNAAGMDPSISGAIGWCAFDYNTHFQFGSGDRICYHGVMDMFRIPKFAAYAYKSQVSPEKELVLEPVTHYTRGDRNIGGVTPLTIFTNCDALKMYVGDHDMGTFYPAKEAYPGVMYPPVIIESLGEVWGMDFEDATIVGYIKGEEKIRRLFVKDPIPTKLSLVADDQLLSAGEVDTTRLVIKLQDQAGNTLPYTDEVVHLEIAGPGTIVGPKTFALIGGCRGTWIKTTTHPGEITIIAKTHGLESEKVTIYVK